MCDLEKFNETLPGKNEFYSSLGGKGISKKEYQYILKVWNTFGMKTMKNYHDLYLKYDLLLLADVFEKKIEIDASNIMVCVLVITRDSVSWDAMFSMTKVEPELISDVDINLFFEK